MSEYKENEDVQYTNEEMIRNSTIFFKNNGTNYMLHHMYEDSEDCDYIFPEVAIVNLETKEKKQFQPFCKMGFIDVKICEQSHVIAMFGYIMGMVMMYTFWDFEGNQLNMNNIVDSKMCSVDIHQFKVDNDKLYFDIIIPEQYFDKDKYPYSNVDFDLQQFTKEDNNLIWKNRNNSYPADNIYSCRILRAYNCTDSICLVNLKELEKIIQFSDHCNKYKYLKQIISNFDNDYNIFKMLVSGKENIGKFKRINVIKDTLCETLVISKSSEIKRMSCYGLYSNNDYFFQHTDIFLKLKFDESFDFGEWLAKNTMGFVYHNTGSIEKKLAPNGIGLVFEIETIHNIIYKFTIKMLLIDVKDNDTLITYDKNMSNITVIIDTVINDGEYMLK